MDADSRPEDWCILDEVASGTSLEGRLAGLRSFRDRVMLATARGREYVEDLQRHTPDLLALFDADPELRRAAARCAGAALDAIEGAEPDGGVISDDVIAMARDLIAGLGHDAAPAFAATLERLLHDLEAFRRRRPAEVLAAPRATRSGPGPSR